MIVCLIFHLILRVHKFNLDHFKAVDAENLLIITNLFEKLEIYLYGQVLLVTTKRKTEKKRKHYISIVNTISV